MLQIANRLWSKLEIGCPGPAISRLQPFVRLPRTMRRHLDGILLAVQSGLTNARLEGTNNKIRMLNHRAFGCHSAPALIATIYLCFSGIQLQIPHLI
jgi:transposase